MISITTLDGHRVQQPGLYRMPANVYHADCCASPSLSHSIAKKLVHRSPLHAWTCHPRLNPTFTEHSSRKMDLGSVAHKMLLGAGNGVTVIEADDYRTNAAREARNEAREAGKIPVLASDHETALQMVGVAWQTIHRVPELAAAFANGGYSELVAVWREGDIWAKCMIDRVSGDLRFVGDYKSTLVAHPAACERRIFDNCHHMQEPWYVRGLDALDPDGRGRRKFVYLFQEVEPPYACTPVILDGHARAMGERQNEAAIALWRRCLSENQWPGYSSVLHRAAMPPWAEAAWLGREMSDESLDDVAFGRMEP